MKRTLQILAVIAGLHLICVVLHQMFMFQHELPWLDSHSLPRGGDTLLGSGAFLWAFHPFLAALIMAHGDSSLAVSLAPLAFVFDSLLWAAFVLAIVRVIRFLLQRLYSNTAHEPGNT